MVQINSGGSQSFADLPKSRSKASLCGAKLRIYEQIAAKRTKIAATEVFRHALFSIDFHRQFGSILLFDSRRQRKLNMEFIFQQNGCQDNLQDITTGLDPAFP